MAKKTKTAAPKKKTKAAPQARRAASKPADQRVSPVPPNEYKERLEQALTELFDIQDRQDKDMAGYRGDFKSSYDTHAKTLGIRQNVLRDEFRRALRNKRDAEKERGFDPVERQQREMLRAATSDLELDGTPMGDWFKGQLATPAETTEEAEENGADKAGSE